MCAPRRIATAILMLGLLGCGGGSTPAGPGPAPTPAPTPTPEPGHTVTGVVFYDEDGSGTLDGFEHARIPEVQVMMGGRSGESAVGSGRVEVSGVPAGTHTVTVDVASLPPFYQPGATATVEVPQNDGAEVAIPLLLPVGEDTRPKVYMAFGDSTTNGTGATPGLDYPTQLQTLLVNHFASAIVPNRGWEATNSYEGIERINRNLGITNPSLTLVMYGTNDWNIPECQARPPCDTVDNLETILGRVRAHRALPVVATIPPVNPDRNAASRNEWVSVVNESIRSMAADTGTFMVDVHAAVMAQPDLASLFSDHVHFNDTGYGIIAEAFFEGLAHGRSTPTVTASSLMPFAGVRLFSQPGAGVRPHRSRPPSGGRDRSTKPKR
jgi:acyl-CoA thioesterase-1